MNQITTHSTQEFMAVCERAKTGEFNIGYIVRGKDNSEWTFYVWYERKEKIYQ